VAAGDGTAAEGMGRVRGTCSALGNFARGALMDTSSHCRKINESADTK